MKFAMLKGAKLYLGLWEVRNCSEATEVKRDIILGLPVGCLVPLPTCTQAPSKSVAIIYPCTCDYRALEYTWLNKNNVLLWQLV